MGPNSGSRARESRLDGHDGQPSQARGYGVMHLVDNLRQQTLREAAKLTGIPADSLRRDTAANIRGGAAVLRARADAAGLTEAERARPAAWYEAVARYGGAADPRTARFYADGVYDVLAQGVDARAEDGSAVTVRPAAVRPDRGAYADAAPLAAAPDYPSALWVPASTANYRVGRTSAITAVVVHVTQGSYAGTISWIQNPASQVSAHYVVRSSDGQVTQMVREKDTAWHARSGNPYSVGIEHEGWVDNPAWFTDAMYRSSAALTRSIADRYGIPKDRAHIVGHVEVPGNDHTDPGPHWDWNRYMQLVGGSTTAPVQLSFSSYATLRTGSTGDQVKAAQWLLNAQGFNAGAVDGDFGTGTATAVRAFQTAKGLGADAVVGAKTWTALLSAGARPLLEQGSSGEAVQRLQRALTAALARTVSADGIFGSGTAQAVRDYQSSRGLGVDGEVGPATWGALQAGR
ncbi:N-acetylmuramoyl-L-alanine amidase [Streptomyces sp. t39]|uniref:peptidoglycan recognition protein family protein n=1 Tax=Streptomyces sp. t39 TaxID=1828156 RepID=UPI0011CE98B4|nr:N-acetylmuramoyl-L-alanine amidase [Streptomyces sp. t39]TXS43847.1 N-acetylmuramoyl-L-alanine amidase [Streptomyces sp. t39]